MTAFKTAYDTTICQGFVTRKTAEALQVAQLNGALSAEPGYPHIYYVQGGGVTSDAVPSFAHPMLVQDHNHQNFLAVDARAVGRYDGQQGRFVVRNEIEYALLQRRAQLNQVWLGANAKSLKAVSALPMAVYASWLSEAIGRRFALDAREQLDLAIMAAVFYNSQFSDDSELDEQEKNRLAGTIARAVRAKAEDVFKVLDVKPVIGNVREFCAAAQELTGSIRLKDLNAGLLYDIIGGTWYGLNAREVIAVALEHPPTWIAVLLAAYHERSFKNSALTTITERPSNKDNGGNFLRSVLTLVQSAA